MSRPRELGGLTTACHWGATVFGECYPMSYNANIPFQLQSGNHYTVDELVRILSDARFVNYSVVLTSPGLNGQRITRASKIYPNSFRLLYWNAYEGDRPGNRISAERIPPRDLILSIQKIMAYELRTQELEIVDDQTQENIFIILRMDNLSSERFYGVDVGGMMDQGSSRGRRLGL